MKKSEIPTDTFAAELSDARLDELEETLSLEASGSRGRVSDLRIQCQLEQIRRGKRIRPAKPPKSIEAQERELKSNIEGRIRAQKYETFHAIEDCPWEDEGKRRRTPEEERAFSYAARARIGYNEGYGDMAEEAIRAGDIQFFKMAIKALESSKKRRTALTKHVKVMIGIYHNIKVAGNPEPTKEELKSMVIALFEKEKTFKPFPFYSDQWETVFERAGLKHLDQGRPGSVQSDLTRMSEKEKARRGLKSQP